MSPRTILLSVAATLLAMGGCTSSTSDDVANTSHAFTAGTTPPLAAPRGTFTCSISYTNAGCSGTSACDVMAALAQVPIGADFPAMNETLGSPDQTPYGIHVIVREIHNDPNEGKADITVIDNRSGSVLQSMDSRISLVALATELYAGTTALINVPSFTYEGATFSQLNVACYAQRRDS
jgi:hypothetical protein